MVFARKSKVLLVTEFHSYDEKHITHGPKLRGAGGGRCASAVERFRLVLQQQPCGSIILGTCWICSLSALLKLTRLSFHFRTNDTNRCGRIFGTFAGVRDFKFEVTVRSFVKFSYIRHPVICGRLRVT